MNIASFKHEMNSSVENFYCWWIDQSNKFPENFPQEMGEADWYEQFTFWMSNQ